MSLNVQWPHAARIILVGVSSVITLSGYSDSIHCSAGVDASAADIFYGDFVKLVNTGTIEKDTGTATATPVGIFMGCFYTDPSTSQPTFNQMWPTGTVADDAMAYVLDDPDAVFRMQGNGALAQTTLGNNIAIVQTSGSTTIGRSKNSVNASTAATTNTLPLRILEFMDGPDSTVGDAYTDVLLTYNEGMHQYRNATGV